VGVSLQGSIPWRFVFLANREKEESPTKCHVQSARYFGNAPNSAATATREKRVKCNKKLGKKERKKVA